MVEQAFERHGEIFARRVIDGEVIQASRARSRWRPVLALPSVESDVVVIAARGEERRALESEEQLEAQLVPR